MCQVDGDAAMVMEERPSFKNKRDKSCMKCGETAVVIARVKDAFCRKCFLAYVTHRFKATIGKARVIRDKEKILIAFSGGQNSSAIARLVQEGRSESQHRKFRFVPSLVYIDDGIVLHQTAEERENTRKAVTKLMQAYAFPSFIVPLEEVLKLKSQTETTAGSETDRDDSVVLVAERLAELSIDERLSRRLVDMLDSAGTLTAKEDLLVTLRNRLLAQVALQTGHTRVMLGDSGTALAARVLAGMAQGRGAAVPLRVGFADDKAAGCPFLRPVREFPSREIALYNRLSGVDFICLPAVTTRAGQYASINALTSEFINGLQVNFPSTVSTVLRTGEKLCSVSPCGQDADCVLCKSPLDTDVPLCSAVNSTQHSMHLMAVTSGQARTMGQCSTQRESCQTTGHAGLTNECCGQGDGSCRTSKNTVSVAELSRWLCYGCRVTLREMKDVNVLPSYALEEAGRRQRRCAMKEEIQDFLLTDEDR